MKDRDAGLPLLSPGMRIPDPDRVAAALARPEEGPRVLFFSGGSALRETSQALVGYTHNSVHLVTPFDSGGSSAILRRYFGMPAVGDLRSRLMALADRTLPGHTEIFDLFTYRLSNNASRGALAAELESLAAGTHPRARNIPEFAWGVIRHHLRLFTGSIGPDFDLRGANIGNLILAAGYLEHGRHMDPIVRTCSRLVRARGTVRLLLSTDLHLQGLLENGERLVGQHLLTGKEAPPLRHAVRELSLVDPAKANAPVRPRIRGKIREAIADADLICYPLGSFYTSLIANLLPAGVGEAIRSAACPKVFIPSTFPDPECTGLSLAGQVSTLLRHLRADGPRDIAVDDVLNCVLLDPDTDYPGLGDPERELAPLGVNVIRTPLISGASGAMDPHKLCRALVSLA